MDASAAAPDVFATWLALLPPALAIVLAMATRAVHLSLFAGLWLGWSLLAGDPLAGLAAAIDALVHVLGDPGDARVVLFSALVGAFIALTQRNGGVGGLVARLVHGRIVATRRRALAFSSFIGVVIFIESSITSLVTGAVSRPIFDRLRISREKLAWICDATAAPVCILIPLNAWGAWVTSLLAKEQVADPLGVFVASIPLNLYAWLTVAFVFVMTVWFQRDFGPMRTAERRAADAVAIPTIEATEPLAADTPTGRARDFVVPLLVLIGMMPVGLLITGRGDMLAGSGSTAVLWAVLAAIAVATILGLARRTLTPATARTAIWHGIGGLVPLAALMMLAFALGAVAKKLGLGPWVVAAFSDTMSAIVVAPAIFAAGAVISFATGTSWGTFALLMPLALPLGAAAGLPPELALAAVLSGGVFGDHCSPISDTTLIASLAAGCDPIDHVRTQLPYALAVAALTAVGFAVLAAIL
jgi:tetracycline resistance efflux pump